jgi:RNA polymerase sigma factor (sigma-70 family)
VSVALQSSELGSWFVRYRSDARRTARRVGCPPGDIDDVVSEAFARVAAALMRVDVVVHEPKAYICAAVRAVVTDRSRKVKVLLVALESVAEHRLPSFVDDEVSEPSDVEQALGRLGERQQVAARAKWIHGFTSDEVAPMIDASTARAVNQILKRARAAVKQEYSRDFD